MVGEAILTAEEKYRLLLEVSEAANSQLELAAVLEAVTHGLAPSIPVQGVSVTTVDGDLLRPQAIYVEGVDRRQGDSFADVVARWLHLDREELGTRLGDKRSPLAGSGTEHVGRTGRAYVCEDLSREARFPEDQRLLQVGVRSYVRVPLCVRERLVGSMSFSRQVAGPFAPHQVELLEALGRPIAL